MIDEIKNIKSKKNNLRNSHFCPVCNSTNIIKFFEIRQVPINCNVLWTSQEDALRVPKGDIELGYCNQCGHIFNLAFKYELMYYGQNYENSLHFSSFFQSYAESIAMYLIQQHDLRNKNIVEIGCGKGEFLTLLCELGANRGFGFDKSYVPENGKNLSKGQIKFIQDFYSDRYAHLPVDFICCRHVLEHIHNPIDFLTNLREIIGNRLNTVVFFEVPNALFTLRDLSIWDIIYEHYSYYSKYSLSRLFQECGFKVVSLREEYEGQFLTIEALPLKNPTVTAPGEVNKFQYLAQAFENFANNYRLKVEEYQRKMEKLYKAGQRVVVWGAGSKGISFLNILKTQGQIEYIVDINPRKQGRYVVGNGQQIVSPDYLQKYHPDVVAVMNSIYKDEIKQMVNNLGLKTEFMYP